MTKWWLVAGFLSAAVGIIGLWMVDVAQVGGQLGNGFWDMSAIQVFHIGLYLAGGSIIGLAVLVVHLWEG